jgi:hypothetical protein
MLSHTRTEALLYCFASAFVPISDENRDGGRAFPNSGKPTPYPGSGPHSPPRWRTRGRRSDLSLHPSDEDLSPGTPAAPARKERFREPAWPIKCFWPWDQRPQLQPDRPVPTLSPSRHTDRSVLAQPSNNNKKSEWGQTDSAAPEIT